MSIPTALDQIVLGHSPVIDRTRQTVAVRLTVFPEPRNAPPDPAGLLAAVTQVWPAPGGAPGAGASIQGTSFGAATLTPVVLNIASEPWLRAVLGSHPPVHVMLEVPAFMAAQPDCASDLHALRAAGHALMVKGRPVDELPADIRPCFSHALIDVDDVGAGSASPGTLAGDGAGTAGRIALVRGPVHSAADLDAALARGATAVVGWPIDGAAGGARVAAADVAVVTELMQRVDGQEPVERLEAVIRNDPQLAFRLIRHLNSAAFGLPVEVSSFRHALMLMGYSPLKRWLALLLVSAGRDPALRPAMFAAVRRGLLMEELVRTTADEEVRGEMFICGVFSLLDVMLGRSFGELFRSVPVPERVQQALVEETGPHHAALTLARALEQGVRSDILAAADGCFLGLGEVNAALLRALAAARELA
jgi:EAL and modified HD-GYP domain-containing signal transduction protein